MIRRSSIIFLACIAFTGVAVAGSGYTGKVVIEDIFWLNHNEWWSDWHAELYLNGVLQPPSGLNYYAWYWQENGQGSYVFDPTQSGYGVWEAGTDNEANEYFNYYVVITLPGDLAVVSDTVLIGKWGDPEIADLYARKENGTLVGGFSADSIGLWSGHIWHWKPPSVTGTTSHMLSSGDTIKVKPNIAGLDEKFHRGETNSGDTRYLNYDSYPVYAPIADELTFHHRRFYAATLQAELFDATSTAGEIQFKDPWLEDESGHGGEYTSQGMSAPFKSHTSPWEISTSSSIKVCS